MRPYNPHITKETPLYLMKDPSGLVTVWYFTVNGEKRVLPMDHVRVV